MLAHLNNLPARMAALFAAPRIMGIVNVTPNSFSDTGKHFSPAAAVAHAEQLVEDGAAILDLGAEASSFFRPGVEPVSASEQIARLLPVLALLKNSAAGRALISVDTRSAEVAEMAIKNGAHMVNDISSGEGDSKMLQVVAVYEVPICLMHIFPPFLKITPKTPKNTPENTPERPPADVENVVTVVADYLYARTRAAETAGIKKHNLLLDPGLGFGLTMPDNWRLVAGLLTIKKLGFPIVLGVSRKRFLETPPPEDVNAQVGRKLQIIQQNQAAEPKPEHPRDLMSAAVTALAAANVAIHRVHNVALCAKALREVESV